MQRDWMLRPGIGNRDGVVCAAADPSPACLPVLHARVYDRCHAMPVDPYAVLDVQNDASDVELRAAYHRLAALYHPDRNPGFQAEANERLKQLNEAYALIRAAAGNRGNGAFPAMKRSLRSLNDPWI